MSDELIQAKAEVRAAALDPALVAFIWSIVKNLLALVPFNSPDELKAQLLAVTGILKTLATLTSTTVDDTIVTRIEDLANNAAVMAVIFAVYRRILNQQALAERMTAESFGEQLAEAANAGS